MNIPFNEGENPHEEHERHTDSDSTSGGSSEDEKLSESGSGSEEDNSEDSENSDSESSSEWEGSEESPQSASASGAEGETETSTHNYLKHITISQDHSEGSGIRNRNLLILKEGGPGVGTGGGGGSHGLSLSNGTPLNFLPRKDNTTKKSSKSKRNSIMNSRPVAFDPSNVPSVSPYSGLPVAPPLPPVDRRGPPGSLNKSGPPPPPPPPPPHDRGIIVLPPRGKPSSRRRRHKSSAEPSTRPMIIPSAPYPSAGSPPSSFIPPQIGQSSQNTMESPPQISSAISQAFLDQFREPNSSRNAGSGNPDASITTLESLQEYIAGLQIKAQTLEEIKRSREPSTYQVMYRIHTRMPVPEPPPGTDMSSRPPPPMTASTYLDCPQWVQAPTRSGEKTANRLKSSLPLYDLSSYIAKHPELSFIVYRDYDGQLDIEDGHDLPPVTHNSESISACSFDLITAVNSLLDSRIEYSSFIPNFRANSLLPAPYLFFYHSRQTISDFIGSLSDQCQRQFSIMLDYIVRQYEEEYKIADSLLSRNRISLPYVKYLFKPGDILVAGSKKNIQAFISKSWPSNSKIKEIYNRSGVIDSYDGAGATKGRSKRNYKKVQSWPIDVWSWKFNGAFSKLHTTINIQLELDDVGEKDIADLNLRPLNYLGERQSQHLRTRGEIFWRCRFRRLISYAEEANRYFQNPADERYMIDLMTYRELHPSNASTNDADELNDELMELDTPPSGNFIYLLPSTIKGYNLQRKKWLDLQVERISEVTWNKEAFKSLVLDLKTKDLIEALISNQLAAEKSTDLISGKGNGLILLLHGGPGTGKTLTAESVAEIAEKPLYRVTCGDIGTEPEQVENYLESVLHLGKTWGCVVLLDEADVFLEQRGLEDLKRNALVSVFLRVLEYYDGILILTSNRVGTFDEAFKSRIQLALHYANLTQYQRGKIWENFISRLETLGEQNIDFNDLKDHVEQLAENEMNGRQIRNAITTARQYAQWKKTVLSYDHLKDIIEISGRFDKYLDKLNDGYSQDQLAQNEGLRFAGPA